MVGCCQITDDTGKVSLEDAGIIILKLIPSEGAVKRGGLDEQIAQRTNDVLRLPKACGVWQRRVSARLRTKLKRKYAFGRLIIDPSTLYYVSEAGSEAGLCAPAAVVE